MRGAPKFPQSSVFELLWRAGLRAEAGTRRDPEVRESEASEPRRAMAPPSFEGGLRPPPQDDGAPRTNRFFSLVELTLDHICEGGIYDHLGGGFSRYSVDERWLVPHFEKMLYDNAQLLELLALAFARTGKPLYRERARETVGWLAREMTRPEGGFSASLDADSEGEEGKFYVWSADEIVEVLGRENAAFFAAHYDVSPDGNFEGHNILNRLKGLPRSMALEDEEPARHAALHAAPGAQQPRAAGPRRQGAGRLERPDDRRPGGRRRRDGRARPGSRWRSAPSASWSRR